MMGLPRLGLILLGAGSGRRMQGIDKVWSPLGSRPIVYHSLLRLAPHAAATVLVVREEHVSRASEELRSLLPPLRIVPGGSERQHSVRHGLDALDDVDVVAIHDVARPFAPASMLVTGVSMLQACDGAIPAIPVGDTIKHVDANDTIVETLDRSLLRAAQTPQIFAARPLRQAYERVSSSDRLFTDDSGLMMAAGYRVRCFVGVPLNFKITTLDDLEIARCLIRQHDL